jgi:hypothetical protein
MARFKSFAKDLQMATAGISPQNLQRELAQFAVNALRDHIHAGEASSRYEKWVNGRYNADEFTVKPPGPILYEFHWWNEIIEYGLEVLQKRSPVRTGRFRDSWVPMVNKQVQTDYSKIPIGAEVLLVNTQPYARKIEVGFMNMRVPPGVAEDSMATIRRRFGNVVEIKTTFVTLPNGYVLKGVFKRGIRPQSRTKLRKDTSSGADQTYPAIRMSMRG